MGVVDGQTLGWVFPLFRPVIPRRLVSSLSIPVFWTTLLLQLQLPYPFL
jgi:hypothetical protein